MTTVFKNGRVHTMNAESPYVTALVVEDDKIVYVGNDAGAAAYEAGAKVVDLDGKMVIPGLIDAHCHPLMSAFITSGALMDAEMSREEVFETIRTFVEEHPDNETYFGMGYPEWVFDAKGPRKEMLDAICADKPVYIMSNGGHEAWANSKTLEVLGIGKDFKDPLPNYSYFRRDPDGTPTGSVIEAAANMVVLGGITWFSEETVKSTYQALFEEYASLGVTGLVDCGNLGDFEPLGMQYYADFEKAGELKQRLCGCAMVEDPEHLKGAVELLKAYNAKYHSDLFNVNTLKILNDGTIESRSCSMYEPYPDGSMVEPMVSGEALRNACLEAAEAGFDIHIHAIGNKSIHETLMAAKAVREAGHFDTRIINAHTHVCLHDDLPLFGKYNVLANTSSIWHYYTPDAIVSVGEQRSLHQFEMHSIIKHGGRITLSSDFPTDELGKEPLKGIQMGVTRQMYNDPEAKIMDPVSERLTVEQCLEGYTINAAYGMHWEDKTGSLEVGKYADLVVLEKDITEIDPHEIMDTPVLLTMLNGKPTYQNEKFSF